MQKFYIFKNALNLKKSVLTILAVGLVTASFSQTVPVVTGTTTDKSKPDKPDKPPGKGPKSDNNNGNAYGHDKNDKNQQSVMLTPSAWGSTQNFAFISTSGTPNQLYGHLPDMAVRVGVGLGDVNKNVSVLGMVNFNDASKLGKNMSYSFIASRALGKNSSITAGAIHLLRDKAVSDGIASYYMAYSGSVKGLKAVSANNPRLSYTIGAGTGAFRWKNPSDYENGKGSYGTAIFANVSYDVVKNWSVNAEWTGTNLGITTSYRLPKSLPVLFACVTHLTRYTGDKPMFVFGVGKSFGFR